MSQFRRSVAVAATLAAVAALPATASATPAKVSAKTSLASVEASVNNAKVSVRRLKRAVLTGESSVAKRQLKLARSQTANASRTARRLANAATNEVAANTAAQALTVAGTQYDRLLETLTALVDVGTAQTVIAGSIQPTIAGKEQILQALTAIMDEVPASVQPTLAAIITQLGAGDATEIVNLNDALNVGSLPSTITGLVSQCLEMAMQAVQTAMTLVQGFLPALPVDVQAPIGTILSQVTGVFGQIAPSILSTITGLIDSIVGSLPIIGGGGLGGLLGGITAGGTVSGGGGSASGSATLPGVGDITGIISSLLGSVLGNTGGDVSTNPVGSVTGIIGTVTGLINQLLGGLLGGLAPAT